MIGGMTGHWKHPFAYLLEDNCPASVQIQLIKEYISLLYVKGIDVLAVVHGTFTIQQMAVWPGSKSEVSDLESWFPHPEGPSSKIYVILDVIWSS